MSEEITPAIEEAVETNPTEQSNMSASEFINRRLGNSEEPANTTLPAETKENPVVEETGTQGETSVEQSNTQEASQEPVSEDALSQFNLDEMSEEDLREMSEKLGSRAVARFGELTARRKQAEERATAMEAEMQKLKADKQKEIPVVRNNPLANVNDYKVLQQKKDTAQQVIEWAEDVLFEKSDAHAEDVVATVKGKEMTKMDVRKSLKQSRDMVNKYVPAQWNKLKQAYEHSEKRKELVGQARKELPFLNQKESELNKRYEAMLQDKRLAPLLRNPEVGSQIPYLLAHATNSIYGRKLIDGNKSPKLDPPKGGPSSSRSEKTESLSGKKINTLSQQFKSSGYASDFITLRTQQLKNR